MKRIFLILILLSLLVASSYTIYNIPEKNYDESLSEDDTIYFSYKSVKNAERLKRFINNIDKVKKDRINFYMSTDEGDPFIYQFYFNGKEIIVAQDYSKDKWMNLEERYIIHYQTITGGNQLKNNLLKYLESFHILRDILNIPGCEKAISVEQARQILKEYDPEIVECKYIDEFKGYELVQNGDDTCYYKFEGRRLWAVTSYFYIHTMTGEIYRLYGNTFIMIPHEAYANSKQ